MPIIRKAVDLQAFVPNAVQFNGNGDVLGLVDDSTIELVDVAFSTPYEGRVYFRPDLYGPDRPQILSTINNRGYGFSDMVIQAAYGQDVDPSVPVFVNETTNELTDGIVAHRRSPRNMYQSCSVNMSPRKSGPDYDAAGPFGTFTGTRGFFAMLSAPYGYIRATSPEAVLGPLNPGDDDPSLYAANGSFVLETRPIGCGGAFYIQLTQQAGPFGLGYTRHKLDGFVCNPFGDNGVDAKGKIFNVGLYTRIITNSTVVWAIYVNNQLASEGSAAMPVALPTAHADYIGFTGPGFQPLNSCAQTYAIEVGQDFSSQNNDRAAYVMPDVTAFTPGANLNTVLSVNNDTEYEPFGNYIGVFQLTLIAAIIGSTFSPYQTEVLTARRLTEPVIRSRRVVFPSTEIPEDYYSIATANGTFRCRPTLETFDFSPLESYVKYVTDDTESPNTTFVSTSEPALGYYAPVENTAPIFAEFEVTNNLITARGNQEFSFATPLISSFVPLDPIDDTDYLSGPYPRSDVEVPQFDFDDYDRLFDGVTLATRLRGSNVTSVYNGVVTALTDILSRYVDTDGEQIIGTVIDADNNRVTNVTGSTDLTQTTAEVKVKA